METAIFIWLGALTLVMLAALRQIAVLSIQAQNNLFSGQEPKADGLELGDPVPPDLEAAFESADPSRPWFALVLSGTCTTCFDIAFNVGDDDVSSPLVALVAGKPELTQNIRAELPKQTVIVEDPLATDIVNRKLRLNTVPFVFEFRESKLVAKAAIQSSDHLKRFITEAESVSNDQFEQRLDEQLTINSERITLAPERTA